MMKDSAKMKQKSKLEKVDPFEMKSFFDQITTLLADGQQDGLKEKTLPNIASLNGECSYITDYKKKKVLLKSGFKSLLGFEDDEVDFDFVFKGYHHEDAIMIKQIIKSVVSIAINSYSSDPDLQLSMTYRRKRKDGSYIHLLSLSTVYELDKNGNLLKSLTRLMDISYLNLATAVSWSIRSKNIDEEEIRNGINSLFENPFTKREIDVIKEIHKGGSNHEIADRLCVSHHTIATHRKNIFRKSSCNTVLDLLLYCKRLDIL
ncbi:LuxR C-terminal-related transcriptional regulator [Lutimonas halocynthiae]|uniref:LuxR C-terminal-related transcriptional regulator n=1 Tax=Lutimonas halocynthiae TaxID=1446477 RepID=UPI0025B4ABCE|nr:LuxR C-terminal-related transcriptional regulator [Lutimonas halocynthiae]MDN3641801.1 LuxR C-terminal-related transcriptional regulator [Lutimonas halocynthiae]